MRTLVYYERLQSLIKYTKWVSQRHSRSNLAIVVIDARPTEEAFVWPFQAEYSRHARRGYTIPHAVIHKSSLLRVWWRGSRFCKALYVAYAEINERLLHALEICSRWEVALSFSISITEFYWKSKGTCPSNLHLSHVGACASKLLDRYALVHPNSSTLSFCQCCRAVSKPVWYSSALKTTTICMIWWLEP